MICSILCLACLFLQYSAVNVLGTPPPPLLTGQIPPQSVNTSIEEEEQQQLSRSSSWIDLMFR